MIEVLVISISNPLLVGVYENSRLIKKYERQGVTSDVLPLVFKDIFQEFSIDVISYVNTPGSYMAIKVAYIFLKTFCIVNNLQFKAYSGFEFNENSPIKALGKKYFINKDGDIKVDFLDKDCKIASFKLPNVLDDINFSSETLPIYNLPAV